MKTTTETVQNNSIEAVLRTQRKGALLTEASEMLQRLVQAVKEHGKGGKLTITLDVSPANGDASAVQVIDDIRIKAPEAPRKGSIFYTTDTNCLVRNNPEQSEMDLKVVEVAEQEAAPRVVNQ